MGQARTDLWFRHLSTGILSAINRALRRLGRLVEIGVLGALFVIGLALSLASDSFLQLKPASVDASSFLHGIMAVGMVFVLSMGDVDLSVGSVLTLVNILTAVALREGVPLPLAVCIGLGAGALCGSGERTTECHPTHSHDQCYLGHAQCLSWLGAGNLQGTPISQFSKDHSFFTIGGGTILGIPASVVVMGLLG